LADAGTATRVKVRVAIAFSLLLLAAGFSTRGQGTFLNLDFESPHTPLVPVEPISGSVAITTALPGWSGYLGGVQQQLVQFNNFALGSPAILLQGLASPYSSPLGGSYSVLLQAGTDPINRPGERIPATTAQTGIVPSDARSLRLRVQGADLELSIGGQVIPIFELNSVASYTVFGGDISWLAGQTAELRLTALSPISHPFNWVYLDSMTFSSQSIPEPGTLGLSLFGGLLFGWRAIRKRGY
jgi:hypothetical protein